jgi:hypothetical protein
MSELTDSTTLALMAFARVTRLAEFSPTELLFLGNSVKIALGAQILEAIFSLKKLRR